MSQPTFFELKADDESKYFLYALGEFQARGNKLAGRTLALDRLLGAFSRAAGKFQSEELSDEKIAAELEKLGAVVKKLPNFVAKHPYRITFSGELAEKAKIAYKEIENE